MGFATMRATKGAGGGTYESPPAGSHAAVLVAIVDLGTHTEEFTDAKTQKKTTKDYRKIQLVWELPGCPMTGYKDRNHIIGKDYRAVFSKTKTNTSALRKLVETWRGKEFADDEEFDITKLLGKKCLVALTHKVSAAGNTFAKLDSVAQLPQGMACPDALRKPLAYSLDDGPIPPDLASWLPFVYGEPVEGIIARSLEGRGKAAPISEQGDDAVDEEADIPF